MNAPPYRVSKTVNRNVFSRLPSRVEHRPEEFGFPAIDGDGQGIRICVIDTGVPRHQEIVVPMTNAVDFTESGSVLDKHGHGSGIAGIIKAKGDNLVGLAPMADLFYAKAIGDDGVANHGSIQAAILYAVVKRVDIIVMAFGSESAHPVLHEAIKKANMMGICIFAASGAAQGSVAKDAEYPARFQEVMSVGFGAGKTPKSSDDGYNINFPAKTVDTLYLDDQFYRMSGTSAMAPVAASIAARILQKRRGNNGEISPKSIYDEMMGLCKND